ncbi:MAG: ankyrin repeat domain-containing protein [Vicinamibacterales bacterium]
MGITTRLVAATIALVLAAVPAMAQTSPVADAAMRRDLPGVKALLAQKADVNQPQGDGSTALHWAAYGGQPEMVRLLLAAGADVTAATRLGGLTPLMMAARAGDAEAVTLLLDAKAEAVTPNANGTTPMMFAAAAGSAAAVRLLAGRGADVNAADATNGQTPLMFAAAQGRVEAVRTLLALKADPDRATKVSRIIPMGERYKQRTAGKGTREITSEGGRSDITAMGGLTALLFAAREGHDGVVRALVEAGADVNRVSGADELSPLTMAIVNGRLDIAAYLLDHGANPNLAATTGVGPLWATIDARWPERTWYPPASITEETTTHVELLKALLAAGADPNVRIVRKPWYRTFHGDWANPIGATPFWLAAKANDVEAMRLLAAVGANPTIPSAAGVSPLLVAAGFGIEPQVTNFKPNARLAAVRYLVEEAGLDVNVKDNQGYTPLHGAALTADHELIQYLIAMGGDVTARASNVFGGENQADKDAGGGKGDTVADMANGPRAHNMQFPETVAFLEALGSANSNNCRYAACVVPTLPSDTKKH